MSIGDGGPLRSAEKIVHRETGVAGVYRSWPMTLSPVSDMENGSV